VTTFDRRTRARIVIKICPPRQKPRAKPCRHVKRRRPRQAPDAATTRATKARSAFCLRYSQDGLSATGEGYRTPIGLSHQVPWYCYQVTVDKSIHPKGL
jgi:hypothetical protein